MKKFILILLTLIITTLVIGFFVFIAVKPPSSQVFINGQILTMDENNTIAEAVLIKGERIFAVGTNQEIQTQMPKGAKINDLKGRTLIPGIIDAHSHFPASGFTAVGIDLNSPPIGNIGSIAEIINSMKIKADNSPANKWVVGIGYDDTILKENRHPTKDDLDKISTDNPVFILHISAHMGVANSAALKELGIDQSTPSPEGGVIVKDINGQPTGLLQETALQVIRSTAFNFSMLDSLKIIKQASKDYARVGVTTAQNGAADKKQITGLYQASRLNIIPMRLEVWPFYADMSDEILNGEFNPNDYHTDRYRVGALKILADGSIQGYTGYLTEPYFKQAIDQQYDSYAGFPYIDREKLTELVTKLYANDTRVAIHGNGDAAIDNILHAIETAQSLYPNDDARTIIIHSQMARDDQLDKMKELGISPSFFSAHTYYWGDRHREVFMGPERAAKMSPAKSALDKGLPFSIHLDTPVVPMNPMRLIWSAVNRKSTSGAIIGEAEQISPMQALRATTIDAAWQIFREDEIGSIEVGKFADLVILNDSFLGNKHAIKDILVDQTFVGGVSIYSRE